MPVPKSRTKQLDLVGKVAQLLEIDESLIFLDARPMCAADSRPADERRAGRKNTLRIWTGNMSGDEKERIRAFKMRVKTLAQAHGTKIAMSDRHPVGEDGQFAFEDRRRANAKNKWKKRKGM